MTAFQNLEYYFAHPPLNQAWFTYVSICMNYWGCENDSLAYPVPVWVFTRPLWFGWFYYHCQSRSFQMPLYNFLSWGVCLCGWVVLFCFEVVFNVRLIINWIRRPGFVIMATSLLICPLFPWEAENSPSPSEAYILEVALVITAA